MRVFRCCYILLGLTLCVFQAWCNRICGTKFTDAASSAHLADIVLEADVTVIWDSARGDYNVSLKVASRRKIFKVYKDTSGSVQYVLKKSRGVITVGEFGSENKEACITEVSKDSSYVFFLRATKSPEYFRISAFPVSTSGSKKANKKLHRVLNSVVCDNCAKKTRISKRLKSISVEEGNKITLKCSASGHPRPVITWMKNGKVLRRAKGMRIKNGKRGSRLQFRRASKRAAGKYMCVAENVVNKAEKMVEITVVKKNAKPTTVPTRETSTRFAYCPASMEAHCLNGGTCLHSPKLGTMFCRCPVTHGGDRCQHQQAVPSTREQLREAKAKLERDRTLIVIGIVIACLVFIVICILSYYLAKQKRAIFYKRREERKREHVNESYKPLLRDEVDSAPFPTKPKKISMTTQTDESVFILMGSGLPGNDQPIQPVVANHVFAHFPNSSPVHLREQPVSQSTNAQPPRYRLNAVSLDAENPPTDPVGRDTPDAPQGSDLSTGKDNASVHSQDSASCDSSTSLPKGPTSPDEGSAESNPPVDDRVVVDGNLPDEVSCPADAAENEEAEEEDEEDSSEEDEEDLMVKHPELKVNLHISEEDLSDLPQTHNATVENADQGQNIVLEERLAEPALSSAGVKCNGIEAEKGVYEEEEDSSSEDSSNSNTSSSSTSLADPEGVPAILSLENHHAKEADGNLSWDEHGTPVIPQYACNPYALDMEDDFVNSQLYEPEGFRLFSENLESPPPPPVGDKLRDVRDDQDAVSL